MIEPMTSPTLFLLPFLAATGHQWAGVASRLDGIRCVTIDLPGFGDAHAETGYTVAAMAESVAAVVRAHEPARWALAGHSMGGKVACAVARMAEDGGPGLGGLERIVLVAASPPGPEPMDEAARADMLGWFAGDDAAARRRRARDYVAGNAAGPLDPAVLDRAAADVARMDPDAWTAWLDRGSREDWAERVGVLRTPALIFAGDGDPALGPEAQRRLVAPHFAHGRLEVLAGAGHLLPLERPEAVARLIAEHLASTT